MLTSGNLFTSGLSGPTGQVIDWIESAPIAKPFKIPLRVAIGVLPAFSASVLLPFLAPLFVIVSLALLFILFNPVRTNLFEYTPKEKHWQICLPVHSVFIIWAAILYWSGNPDQISRTVGGIVLVIATAIWPVYMSKKKYASGERKVSFTTAYFIVSGFVFLQQLLIISRSLINA